MITWDQIYDFFGAKDLIYFISSPQLQDYLFPVKLVFAVFTMFFLAATIYFLINSSYLHYKFLEDTTEFFSWQSYGSREITKKWNKIKNRTVSGLASDFKLAIIDADDLLAEILEERGYEGKDFEEMIRKTGRLTAAILEDILLAHEARNSIVYNPDFEMSVDKAKKILDTYESAINNIGVS